MPQIPVEQVTLTLAIASFGPALLAAIGLFFLARLTNRTERRLGDLASTGMIVTTIGGLARAVWMVVAATRRIDAPVLDGTELGLIAPGLVFVALAFLAATGVERVRRPAHVTSRTAVALLVLAFGFGFGQARLIGLDIILVAVAIVAATAVLGHAVHEAQRRGLPEAVVVLSCALAAMYAIVGLAALQQTTLLQWVIVVVHVGAMAAFARGAWILAQRYVVADLPQA